MARAQFISYNYILISFIGFRYWLYEGWKVWKNLLFFYILPNYIFRIPTQFKLNFDCFSPRGTSDTSVEILFTLNWQFCDEHVESNIKQ